MALKLRLREDEKYGLNQQEIILAEKYLRKNKTAGALNDAQAFQLWEMFLIGHSFADIHKVYPEYEMGQIILTAALRGWAKDKERMNFTLQDRVRSRVIRTVMGQVDFLTTMLDVSVVEHLETMRQYVRDPANAPKPSFRASSIKDYKDVSEALYKLVQALQPKPAPGMQANSPLYNLITPGEPTKMVEERETAQPKKAIELEDIVDDE